MEPRPNTKCGLLVVFQVQILFVPEIEPINRILKLRCTLHYSDNRSYP